MARPKKTASIDRSPPKTTASKACSVKKRTATSLKTSPKSNSIAATLTLIKHATSPPASQPASKRKRKATRVKESSSEEVLINTLPVKKISVKKATVKKVPVIKSPVKKVNTKDASAEDAPSATYDWELQNAEIAAEEPAAQDQLLRDAAADSFLSYGWTIVNDPKPKLAGEMARDEYDIEAFDLTEDEYPEPLDPDGRPVRELIDNLEAGPNHLKLVHVWLKSNASPGTVKDYFTPFGKLIDHLGFESPALALHEMSALRMRTIAVIKAEGKKLKEEKGFTVLKNGAVEYAAWTDRWLEDGWNGSITKPAKSASVTQPQISNKDSPQVDKEFPLQSFIEHVSTSFTLGQYKVICVWMKENSVVTGPGEARGLVGDLYDKLGFGASGFDQHTQTRMKAKLRGHIIKQAKKFKQSGAIIDSESKPNTMEYAEWTECWLEKDWDGSIIEPGDAEMESDVETLSGSNDVGTLSGSHRQSGPSDKRPLVAKVSNLDGGKKEDGQPQQEYEDYSSEGEEVTEEEYALVREARHKEFFKGEKWQTTTPSLHTSTPRTSIRRAARKPIVGRMSGAGKGQWHVEKYNDVEMANSSNTHTTSDVTDNTNKISSTPAGPMMAAEITADTGLTPRIIEPLIKQSKTMKEIQMKTITGEMPLPTSGQCSQPSIFRDTLDGEFDTEMAEAAEIMKEVELNIATMKKVKKVVLKSSKKSFVFRDCVQLVFFTNEDRHTFRSKLTIINNYSNLALLRSTYGRIGKPRVTISSQQRIPALATAGAVADAVPCQEVNPGGGRGRGGHGGFSLLIYNRMIRIFGAARKNHFLVLGSDADTSPELEVTLNNSGGWSSYVGSQTKIEEWIITVHHHRSPFTNISEAFQMLVLELHHTLTTRLYLADGKPGSTWGDQNFSFSLRFENVWGSEPRDSSLTIIYNLDWDVPRFVQLFGEGIKLGQVLTITGDGRDAQACCCREYMAKTWPSVGNWLLDGIEKMLATDIPVKFSPRWWWFTAKRRMILSHTVNKGNPDLQSTASFQITTTYGNHQHLAAAISWLCAVTRTTSHKHRISLSQTEIMSTKPDSERRHKTLIFRQGKILPISPESCWHSLFSYVAVAIGFPIRKRLIEDGFRGNGLEVTVAPLLELSNSRLRKLSGGGLVFEGISAYIYPTKRLARGDMQLHLEVRGQDGNFATGNDPSAFLKPPLYNPNKQLLNSPPTLPGLGVGRRNDGWGKPKNGARIRFASMFQFGLSRTFGNPAVASSLSRIVDLDKHNVNFIFENATRQYILIWDDDRRTAWLVPQISLFLLLLQVYLTKRPGAVPEELPNKLLYARKHADGANEALKTIYGLVSPEVNKTIPRLHKSDARTYMEVLQNIVFNFQCHHRDFNIIYEKHRRISPKKIFGVELEHLAFCRLNMPVKEAVVNSAWANIALGEPGLVVFCSGLGEAIEASSRMGLCPAWYSVPPDKYYFGVIGYTLWTILRERTRRGKSKLADNVEWTRINQSMPLIVPHTKKTKTSCNHLQWLRTTWGESEGEEHLLNVVSQYLNCGFVFATYSSRDRKDIPQQRGSWALEKEPEDFYKSHQTNGDTTNFHLPSPSLDVPLRPGMPPPGVHYPIIPRPGHPPIKYSTKPNYRDDQGGDHNQSSQNGHNAMHPRPLSAISSPRFPKEAPPRKPLPRARRPLPHPIILGQKTSDHSLSAATASQNMSGQGGSTSSATTTGAATTAASSSAM
ncbi:hypothetical protein B7494_g7727 [Chlorociboria aeruginascens]|nr:hypothetical protein B7494_g7727 [Chlorociboria aeruginascens]